MKQQSESLDKTIQKRVHLNYLSYLPPAAAADPLRKWPAIFFLHGSGERGENLQQLTIYGIPLRVEHDEDFPFITISPQCPEDNWWLMIIDELDALFEEVVARYPIDLSRVYLTGLSMGGYGVWSWAVRHPERFAALAPVCGGGFEFEGFPERVCELKDIPVWAFHGGKDTVVPVQESEVMVKTLQACGGQARLTIYPEAGHNAWDQAYNTPELYPWFMEHHRS